VTVNPAFSEWRQEATDLRDVLAVVLRFAKRMPPPAAAYRNMT
jgi:hypothetical protein